MVTGEDGAETEARIAVSTLEAMLISSSQQTCSVFAVASSSLHGVMGPSILHDCCSLETWTLLK